MSGVSISILLRGSPTTRSTRRNTAARQLAVQDHRRVESKFGDCGDPFRLRFWEGLLGDPWLAVHTVGKKATRWAFVIGFNAG